MNAAVTVPLKMTTSFRPENKIDSMAEDDEFLSDFNRFIDDASIKDAECPTPDSFDPYLNMELSMPRGPT